jgi:hypothetical protein
MLLATADLLSLIVVHNIIHIALEHPSGSAWCVVLVVQCITPQNACKHVCMIAFAKCYFSN